MVSVIILSSCNFKSVVTNTTETTTTIDEKEVIDEQVQGNKIEDGIPTVYMTDELMAKNNAIPTYEPNNEITGTYDKALAAKCVNGTFVGKLENGVKIWRGIPYAKQPVGELRFKKSEAPEPSDKIFEAYHYGKSCLQPDDPSERASMYEQGEDCLTLAVYTYDNDIKNKPVLVYIHGGGWALGGTVDPLYKGSNFVSYNPNMIVIDITYRLGLMGQLNLSKLDGYNDEFITSHNNGILDQIQALKWIKGNISAFGGDPSNITICGESAGGGSVSLLVLMASDPNNKYMPHGENLLFKKAISMSGGINQLTSKDDSYKLTDDIINWLLEKKGRRINSVVDMQNVPFDELREFWRDVSNVGHLNYCVLDGNVLPKDAYGAYKKYVDDTITVLQGATTNEFAYYRLAHEGPLASMGLTSNDLNNAINIYCTGPTVLDPLFTPSLEFTRSYNKYMEALEKDGIRYYNDKMQAFANDYTLQGINYYQAEQQAHNKGTVYTYAFNQPYDETKYNMKAGHAIDCFYLFGNFVKGLIACTDEQVDFSRRFMKYIANFCTTGDPSTKDLNWKPYTVEEKYCAKLDAKEEVLIKNYTAERIEYLCGMFDTNPKMRAVPNWADIYTIAMGTVDSDVAEEELLNSIVNSIDILLGYK